MAALSRSRGGGFRGRAWLPEFVAAIDFVFFLVWRAVDFSRVCALGFLLGRGEVEMN